MTDKQTWYRAMGVVLSYRGDDRWGAKATIIDPLFADTRSSEGSIGTRYITNLTEAIDVTIEALGRLGVTIDENAALFVEGDGEDEDEPLPDDWRKLLKEQSDRLGWQALYLHEGADDEQDSD